MIHDRTQGFNAQSTIQGRDIRMGIDEASMAHIMMILTDLYSDPEQAIIREYSTNGRDAHIEAGESRPIEVTTPTPLSLFLRIKDYGVGLSAADIAAIYSKYGASTKRATNDQQGMLGLGCKSALTYSNQFSLVGVKDGVRCTVSISRDDQGAGNMTVVDESATDEPNGVEVVIPARRDNQIASKAEQFFRFWPEGSVLLDGKAPKRLDGTKLTDNLYIVERENKGYGNRDEHMVVMGNVAYPIEDHFELDGLNYAYRLIAFVDIGDVHFTPSREDLHYTPTTKATLQRITSDFAKATKAVVQRDVDNAKTHSEAVQAYVRWSDILNGQPRGGIQYKGMDIPHEYVQPGMIVSDPKSYTQGQHSKISRVYTTSFANALWVYGFKINFTATHKKKLNQYVEEQGMLGIGEYVMCPDKPDMTWLSADRVVDYDTIREVKLPSTGVNAGPAAYSNHIPGSYKAYHNGSYRGMMPCDEIDKQTNIFYYPNGSRWSSGGAYTTILDRDFPADYVLVMVSDNRQAKFLRLWPQAKEVTDYVKESYESWKKSLHPLDLKALDLHYGGGYYSNGSNLSRLKSIVDRLDDPELVSQIKLASRDIKAIIEQEKEWQRLGYYANRATNSQTALDKYPLADVRSHLEHTVLYINAAYAAQRKEA